MNYNNSHFKKLLQRPVNNLVKDIIDAVIIKSPVKNDSYKHDVKYTLEDYVIGIIDVLKSSVSWNNYSGLINGNTLRKKHNEWQKIGIYEHTYKKYIQ